MDRAVRSPGSGVAREHRSIVDYDTDPEALTDFFDVVLAGMSARARDGAAREQLEATVDRAMEAWPEARWRIQTGAWPGGTGRDGKL